MPATLRITYGIPATLGSFGGTLPVLNGDTLEYEEITVDVTSTQSTFTVRPGEVALLKVDGDNTRIKVGANPTALDNAGAMLTADDEVINVSLRVGQKIAAILSA